MVRERERVAAGRAEEDLIVLRGIRKVYAGGKVAVKDASFGIPRGECFGFLVSRLSVPVPILYPAPGFRGKRLIRTVVFSCTAPFFPPRFEFLLQLRLPPPPRAPDQNSPMAWRLLPGVSRVCTIAQRPRCFALVCVLDTTQGINGAGKTTTLKILSGDIIPTRGTAALGGLDILSQQVRLLSLARAPAVRSSTHSTRSMLGLMLLSSKRTPHTSIC